MLDYQPVYLSVKVAICALAIVFVLGVSLAYSMRSVDFPGKAVVESLFTLPLVLPPVVTGFLLLLVIGRQGPVGKLLQSAFNVHLLFTPYAAVMAGAVVAFPLMYQSAKAAFQGVDRNLEDAARTLGSSEWRVFWTVTMPLSWPGLVAGLALSFSRALGEFGATIMVAGNIPGKTQTIPLAIYFAAESNDLTQAGGYVAVICLITFSTVLGLNMWSKTRGNDTTDAMRGWF